MNIAVLGTGMVGQTIASKLVGAGHRVRMGSRQAGNEKALAWMRLAGAEASQGDFAGAAAFGELIFNCTAGGVSLEVLRAAGAASLRGKILIDLSNPLDFSKGRPPTLSVVNSDSIGEQIQRAFPETRVVKTLNTLTAALMLNPGALAGAEHSIFVSGNDPAAKAQVTELLRSFGWKDVIDLGDITTARGTEMYLPLWLRMWGALGTANLNIKVVRG